MIFRRIQSRRAGKHLTSDSVGTGDRLLNWRYSLPERWCTVITAMGNDAMWPRPSESRCVRTLLYLSEGAILGAGVLLFSFRFAGAYLIDVETGSFNPALTVFGAFTLLLVLFFLLRAVAVIKVSLPSPESQPEYQNWSETRKWRWVFAVALPVGGVLFGVAMYRWSWWEIVFLQSFDLLLIGAIIAGLVLYAYVLHKIGM